MRAIAVISLLCTVLTCAQVPVIPAFGAAPSTEREKRIWEKAQQAEQALEESGLIYLDEELQAYLTQVLEKILPQDPVNPISFRIVILNNPYLNAFAFPNGFIYIHSGLLARMDNEAQLAVLLAHEMTHIAKRHAFRVNGPSEHDVPAMEGCLGNLEREADRAALERAYEAGYDPGEALTLLETLKGEFDREEGGESVFLEDQSCLAQRIKEHEIALTAYSKKGGFDRDGKAFLFRMRKVILDTARMDLKAGRFPAAMRGVEKYLSVCPEDAEGHFLKGEAYRQRAVGRDLVRAKEEYAKAIFLDPSSPEPQEAMGLLYLKEGEKRLARIHFEMFLFLSPDSPHSAYILTYLKRCWT